MNSAYQVLGVPGNAAAADIEAAFQRARTAYPSDKFADDPQLAERMAEVLNAYKVLRDPESRAAHDRKLAQQGQPSAPRAAARPQTAVVRESSGLPRGLVLLGLAAALLFGGGFYLQHRRQAAQAELAAKEAEAARLQAIADAEAERTRAAEAAARARREADERARELAFRRESDAALVRAQNIQARQDQLNAQQRLAEQREVQRKEAEFRADEQRRVMEGQRRLAADKQRIRELCYINYRRYDC